MAKCKIQTSRVAAADFATKVLLIGAFENEFPVGTAALLNSRTGGLLVAQSAEEEFKCAVGTTMVSFTNNTVGPRRVLVYGLGKRESLTLSVLRKALIAAFKRVKALKVDAIAFEAIDLSGTKVSAQDFGEVVGTISALVGYNLNHQKTEKGGHKPEVTLRKLVVLEGQKVADGEYDPHVAFGAVKRGIDAGVIIAAEQNNTRDLVNMPPSECNSVYMASYARELPRRTKGKVKVTVHGKKAIQRMGMGGLLGVNRGSAVPPKLIVAEYKPANARPGVTLGLVGKSITFDTGGLDIKGAEGMRTMKCDMAGGATVLSAIAAIAALELPVHVIAVTAATDNAIGPKSYKPGDVIKTMNGRTIEVDNTDAEGRVTLADAIEFTKQLGATHLVDLATLTGAVLQTCADVGAGLFSNNDGWAAQVKAAANAAGELVQVFEMWPEIKEANETAMADLKNSGASFGGAGSTSAAFFLAEFAEDTPWVHLDIAGTAYRKRALHADPQYATGWGVRTLVSLARNLAAKK